MCLLKCNAAPEAWRWASSAAVPVSCPYWPLRVPDDSSIVAPSPCSDSHSPSSPTSWSCKEEDVLVIEQGSHLVRGWDTPPRHATCMSTTACLLHGVHGHRKRSPIAEVIPGSGGSARLWTAGVEWMQRVLLHAQAPVDATRVCCFHLQCLPPLQAPLPLLPQSPPV